jgi:3-oxoacyl-[acyl-carrier-protein] synthase III
MLSIHGMGASLPPHEITNEFLHEKVGLKKGPDWVRSRLGIYRRFSVLTNEYILETKNRKPSQAIQHARANGSTPVTMGIDAARCALERAGLAPEDIGWVIASNDTPFETTPGTAITIARHLGIQDGPHCDINTACSSFARHLQIVEDTRDDALPDFVLSIQTSACTVRVDYGPDCADGYILGDGAAAQILSKRHPGALSAVPMIFATDPSRAEDIVIDSVGHFVQNGEKVREFSVRKTCEIYESMAARTGLDLKTAFTVAHQANAVMQDSVIGHLGIPEGRHLRNVQDQGNIAGASCPSVIAQNWDRFQPGDHIFYAVVGAGLAWGGGLLERRPA